MSRAAVVAVGDHGFSPERLTISCATAVEFRATGSLNHLIVSDSFASPLLKPGDSWTLGGVRAVGVLQYHCEILRYMKGVLEVGEAAGGGSAAREEPAARAAEPPSSPACCGERRGSTPAARAEEAEGEAAVCRATRSGLSVELLATRYSALRSALSPGASDGASDGSASDEEAACHERARETHKREAARRVLHSRAGVKEAARRTESWARRPCTPLVGACASTPACVRPAEPAQVLAVGCEGCSPLEGRRAVESTAENERAEWEGVVETAGKKESVERVDERTRSERGVKREGGARWGEREGWVGAADDSAARVVHAADDEGRASFDMASDAVGRALAAAAAAAEGLRRAAPGAAPSSRPASACSRSVSIARTGGGLASLRLSSSCASLSPRAHRTGAMLKSASSQQLSGLTRTASMAALASNATVAGAIHPRRLRDAINASHGDAATRGSEYAHRLVVPPFSSLGNNWQLNEFKGQGKKLPPLASSPAVEVTTMPSSPYDPLASAAT
ncbi:hypothetical protein AB1Y20_001546 [Prymnesium parvum]|uniref:Uncharacterized protein n=1 Tax=Prymnesium parvum TaxID=97485 RepID=A0AB34K8N3_PRYPA